MAFMRRVRTASGATAVQIAEYADGRQQIVKHVGSAHTEAQLGVLLQRARELGGIEYRYPLARAWLAHRIAPRGGSDETG